ncbi:hypothetical protein SUDANB140_06983 [Streptomyces sp. enrichment culture]
MHDYLGLDVHGATLCLIGYGQIGRAVARRAQGFGMRVLHHAPYSTSDDAVSTATDLDTLPACADSCRCTSRSPTPPATWSPPGSSPS